MKSEAVVVESNKLQSVKKTAFNAFIIYAQRFATAGFALITTPLVLNALGVSDFGLYTLTIGFVGFLSFLTWSLSSGTQRYIAVALGKKDFESLKHIFSTAFSIHLAYGLLMLLGISTFGFFLEEQMLSVPENRLESGRITLVLVSLLTFFSIITVPFTGVLRAYENFKTIAVFGIIESSLKLTIAAVLFLVSTDRLIFYSGMLSIVGFILFISNAWIVFNRYQLVKLKPAFINSSLIKEMLGFFSWNMIGALAIVSRNQGVAVLINIFFGVLRNAAYGIALQVSAAMAILSQGIIGSMSPKIMKAAGAGDHQRMIFLMRTMSKFAIFSISIIAIPVFFEAPLILQLWLKNVPDETVTYIRLIIILGQVMLLSAGIQTVFDALGKVKTYNLVISLVLLFNLPISFIFFKAGFASYTILVVSIVLETISWLIRIYLLKREVEFNVIVIIKDTLIKIFFPTACVVTLVLITKYFIYDQNITFFTSFLITFIAYPFLIYFLSLETEQKLIIRSLGQKLLIRLRLA